MRDVERESMHACHDMEARGHLITGERAGGGVKGASNVSWRLAAMSGLRKVGTRSGDSSASVVLSQVRRRCSLLSS